MKVKKFLAGFLSAMMVISLLPSTAFATEIDTSDNGSGGESVVAEHEHDFETDAPVLSEDGTMLIYTCAVEGCDETYEEEYVPDTPTVMSDEEPNSGDESNVGETQSDVAQIVDGDNVRKFPTLQAAIKAAEEGDTIHLLTDIELTEAIYLTKSVTIDGAKSDMTEKNGEGCYKVSAPIGANGRVFNLDGSGSEDTALEENATVTFQNIQIVGPMTAVGDTRGISVYQTSGLKLSLKNAYVSASCYPLNLTSYNTELTVEVTDSKLEGWCALQTWSPVTVNISGSELIGTNQYTPDSKYSFATIVVNQCSVASKITVTNSTIKALSEDSSKNLVEVLSIQNINNTGSQEYPSGNEITFTDCKVTAEGQYTDWSYDGSKWSSTDSQNEMQPLYYVVGANTLSINGSTYFVPDYGYAIEDVLQAAATITRDGKTITYGSLDAAIWDVKENETITLAADNTEEITVDREITFTVDKGEHEFDPENIKSGDEVGLTYTGDETDNTYNYSIKGYVASVTGSEAGEKKYTSMSDAYNNAEDDDIITLLTNAEWQNPNKSSGISIAKSITIDLKGYTLTLKYINKNGTPHDDYLYLNTPGCSLTIEDNSAGGNGKIETGASYVARVTKGSLILKSGTLSGQSTRTVYVAGGTFKMNGGTLINSSAVPETNASNANVLEVYSGSATITDGVIESTGVTTDPDTNETVADPAPGARQSGTNGMLTVNGGTFKTGTAAAIVNSGKGTLTVTGGDFTDTSGPSVSVTAAGTTMIGSEADTAELFNLPELQLNSSGIVTVYDNVTVTKVTATTEGITFSAENKFGGQYGNDFTDYIKGIAHYCEITEGSDFYKVVPITDENSDLVVATITRVEDGKETTLLFGSLSAAMTALQNDDTLTLKQNVTDETSTSWRTTASNVTIKLNNYTINAAAANCYGLYFNPKGSNVKNDDKINIIGPGEIKSTKYAIYCTNNGVGDNLYTLEIDDNVTLTSTGEEPPINLANVQARLYLKEGQNGEYNYTKITNGFKTTIGNKTYVYNSPAQALNAQQDDGGTVTLLSDFNVGTNLVTSDYKVILDLNGHTLTGTGKDIFGANGAGLTIQNGTIKHKYTSQGDSSTVVAIDNTGKGGAELTLKDVTITESSAKSKSLTAVIVNGTRTGVKVTLKDCTIQFDDSCTGVSTGVYFPVNGGVLNITDTKITAQNALQIKGGTVTVKETDSGKTVITSTGVHADPAATSSGCTNTGDGIYVEDTYGYNPTVYVLSGTVKSEGEGTSALLYFDNDQENATGSIQVSGGEFSSVVPDQYCTEGYQPVITLNSNDMYTVEMIEDGYELVGNYKGDRAEADWLVPVRDNKVFAGWYTDESCTTPYMDTTGAAYPKFVDENVLSIQKQLKYGTTSESELTDIRFITTVDSLNYKKVGFQFVIMGKESSYESTEVYRQLAGTVDGSTVTYTPDRFSSESQYFLAHTIRNIPKSAFDTSIEATPYWVTLDGTRVEGISSTVTVNGSLSAN